MSESESIPGGDCVGLINFMTPSSLSSLFRNGKVKIDRDPDGDTNRSRGVKVETKSLTIFDARQITTDTPNCETNGFELQNQPLADPDLDFLDHEAVVRSYYSECERIVGTATSAKVFAFDHNLRSASGKESQRRISGGQNVQGPAHMVHGDYTLRGAPERLMQLTEPPSGNDTLKGYLREGKALIPQFLAQRAIDSGRFAIINVWRNIADEPVATNPLALCDGQTVVPDDLVVFEIHYPDRIGENYFSKPADRHQFYYYPAMTKDEALLIKQWDSAGRLASTCGKERDTPDFPCTFSFHTSFNQPEMVENKPDRWSVEVRCMVIYE